MKTLSTQRLLLTLVLLIAGLLYLQAQESTPNKVVLIQKIVNDDGTQTVIKKSIATDQDLEVILPEFKLDNAEYVAIQFMNGKEFELEKKAFLGVYPTSNPEGEGVLLNGIIANTCAAAAGLHNGDVLLAIDAHPLPSNSSLEKVLSLYEPNDQITITFLRNGQTLTTSATLGARDSMSYSRLERDPCQVFIGVTIGGQGQNGLGTRISEIIPNTPADAVGLQSGDIILSLDDVETNTHEALLHERNKHQPGEWFTLSILRNGQVMDVDAQFKSCDIEKPAHPIEGPAKADAPATQNDLLKEPNPVDPIESLNYTLTLQDFSAYPNPTYGDLNIRFQATAKPTTIRITDVTGRVVFEETREDFDGYYARPVDLQNAQPGLLMLTIQQENKTVSAQIILLSKA